MKCCVTNCVEESITWNNYCEIHQSQYNEESELRIQNHRLQIQNALLAIALEQYRESTTPSEELLSELAKLLGND